MCVCVLKGSIPSNINNPNPGYWGLPNAAYPFGSWCPQSHFQNMQVVINTCLCGDWAGSAFSQDGCGNNCNDYVANNPSAFSDAYWQINYIKIYQ